MEFGFSLPGRGPLATPEVALKIAAKADALRYSSVFVTDHIALPVSSAKSTYPYSTSGQFPGGSRQDYLEPLVMLSYLACATARVRLGTSVLVVPYRNPLVTAKMLATIDLLSQGRIILGAGVGWLAEEFAALQAPPFEARGAVTDEYLQFMRKAWTTDPVSFAGEYYQVADVHVLPKPVQPGGIPIWIGGHTEAALRRVGRLADAWHPIGQRPPALLMPEEYEAKVKRIAEHARAAGRDPASITLTLRVPMEVRSPRAKPPAGDRPLFQGTAAEVLADLERYRALGVSHFVFDPTVPDTKAVLANMERFADEVRGKAKSAAPGATSGRERPAAKRRRERPQVKAARSHSPSRSGHPRRSRPHGPRSK